MILLNGDLGIIPESKKCLFWSGFQKIGIGLLFFLIGSKTLNIDQFEEIALIKANKLII